jgi:hypothetical protein
MGKQTPVIEWYVAKDDTEWMNLCPLPVRASAPCAAPPPKAVGKEEHDDVYPACCHDEVRSTK